MPKILHITQDEKFTEAANKQFQMIFPKSNDFFIITSNIEKYELRHVKEHQNFRFLRENKESCIYIISQLKNYDLIVLHNLDFFKSEIVLNTDKPVLWLYWGFEMYNTHKVLKSKLLGPQTSRINKKLDKIKPFSLLAEYLFKVRTGRLNMDKTILRAAKKIQYFGTGIKEEFELLKAKDIINAEFFHFSYYNLESYVSEKQNITQTKNNILLGNSATVTNNHLEAMDILKKFNDTSLNIIVPLNYGNMEYGKKVIEVGEKTFGKYFKPLNTFIPLDEYNKILDECKIFVMNSYRQQALGNIYTMLYQGAKVYLDERNLAYQFLKRIGCIVFSITKDLNPENKFALVELNPEEQANNKKVIGEQFGITNQNTRIKNQLLEILKKE